MRVELTKRADYAIRAVLALAHAKEGELMSVRRVALEEPVPVRFLPQVMTDLVRAGLADGVEGRGGGYRLARTAASISLLDIIEAIEGNSRRRVCVLRGGPVLTRWSVRRPRSVHGRPGGTPGESCGYQYWCTCQPSEMSELKVRRRADCGDHELGSNPFTTSQADACLESGGSDRRATESVEESPTKMDPVTPSR